MLIFIDETGNLGFDFSKKGTSSHFVITALVLADQPQRRALEKAVERTLKNKVNVGKKVKKHPVHELKGRDTAFAVKEYFWRQVQAVPFTLYAIALNKERGYPALQQQKERLYNYLARLLIDRIPLDPCGPTVHVEIDKSKGRRERTEFNAYLEHHLKGRIAPKVPLSIYHMLSEQSKAIQATDLFSWGIARKYERGDQAWYDVFCQGIAFETLYLLPQP